MQTAEAELTKDLKTAFEPAFKAIFDRFDALEKRLEKQFPTKRELAELKHDLLKWMFIFWTGTIAAIVWEGFRHAP